MSQQKKKSFKEEVNQPEISTFIQTPGTVQVPHRSRSRSVKRKCTTSGENIKEKKRLFTEESNTETFNMETSDISQPGKNPVQTPTPTPTPTPVPAPTEPLTLAAVKDLLQPMQANINEILITQWELKNSISEAATLKEENEKLKHRMEKVETANKDLCQKSYQPRK